MSADNKRKGHGWPRDFFGRREAQSHFWFGGGLLLFIALAAALLFPAINAFKGGAKDLIIYTSQDQQFAEPILREFKSQTGQEARAVFDSEAVKTVGLANRLLAEARHPQCDVWWSNEALRTHQLTARGVLDTNSLVTFGYRSRRIVINTNALTPAAAPKSLLELTNARWRGKVALAYPMFGTTSAQFIALRRHWGAERWEQWCRALAANKPFLVDGNSVVVKLVGRGEAALGLTDFDDIAVGQREGLPVAALPLDAESVLIPNTVALVRKAQPVPHAQTLARFVASDAMMDVLVQSYALEGRSLQGVPHLQTDWRALVNDLEPATEKMRQIFLR